MAKTVKKLLKLFQLKHWPNEPIDVCHSYVTTEELGLQIQRNEVIKKGKPNWYMQIELKIKKICLNLSNLKNLKQGTLKKKSKLREGVCEVQPGW